MLHTDMIVAISEYEYRLGVIDAQGHSHEDYVEASNSKVIIAKLDGKTTIFFAGEALRTTTACYV